MIRIAVCDDDEYMLEKLKFMIDREFAGHTSDYIIKCYSSAGLLLDDNSSTAFDIIFLDIDMPETDGFETAEKLRNDFMQCYIIFVTSHSNLVYRSFDFQPFHFIPKNPASTENSAPIKKQTAVPQLMKTPISTTSAATKKTRILYSAFRNASAPSAIAEAISCILAFPGDERIT